MAHYFNIMLGRGLGGIERAFINCAEALLARGHRVTCVASPKAAVIDELGKIKHPNLQIELLRNFAVWDCFAIQRLSNRITKLNPDAILTHGTRAATFARRAAKHVPVAAFAHNYSIRRLLGAEVIFAISKHLKETIEAADATQNVVMIPNMIRMTNTEVAQKPFQNPPVIGSMGRFVQKKGFADLLDALALLKKNNISFKAMIAGDGEESAALKEKAEKLGLSALVSFPGWIKNPDDFYNQIDFFVLPSLHEPFGIVLLEAFAKALGVVSTDTEGPSEIVTRGKNALVVERGNVQALADAMKTLLYDPAYAHNLGKAGLETVKTEYDMNSVGRRIETELQQLVLANTKAA
ncbi:MAG: glycosyltransferase family 1 protein [Proteobacteria bacterium]|nr:glycosyltransferase family 1 protein [Pseudomonadota bacterium]